jgi:hypothetical protein
MASDGDWARPGDRGLGSGEAPIDMSCRDRTGVGDSGWKLSRSASPPVSFCNGEACVAVNEYCCSMSWCWWPGPCPTPAGMPPMHGSEIRVSRSEKSAIKFESGWFSDTVESDEMRECATELLVDEALVYADEKLLRLSENLCRGDVLPLGATTVRSMPSGSVVDELVGVDVNDEGRTCRVFGDVWTSFFVLSSAIDSE